MNTIASAAAVADQRQLGESEARVRLAERGRCVYPPGATNANWFGLFNALAWQITLGSPVILYAKSQGASATVLGIIAALTPLLVIFQIPAAHYLPRYGYRRFILAGWGSRTLFIFGIAAVPLLAFASAGVKIGLLIFCLFAFNLLRGITSGAWMPWMSELIPDELRGRFLSRDQVFAQIGCLGAMTAAAVGLSGANPAAWQFAAVFAFSAAAATVSLVFVKRIPDVTTPEKLKKSGHRVPWPQMLAYPPFFRLTLFNLLYVIATAGLSVFTVAYLKGEAGYSESHILWLSTFSFIGALFTVRWVGRFVDRNGSKPVLQCTVGMFFFILAGWWLMSAKVIAPSLGVVALVYLLFGIANTNFNIANNRLLMETIPLMGRNHFFAIYTVITSVATGLAPIAQGIVLDLIGGHETVTHWGHWNRFSIYFASMLLVAIATGFYGLRLHEKIRSRSAERSIVLDSPQSASAPQPAAA